MSGQLQIVCGDGIAGLLSLAPDSVALVLTDPPWGQTSAPWDRALDWHAWWAARPFRYDLVWRKNKATGHLDAKKRPMRQHESLLVFGGAKYEPQFTTGHEPMHAATRRSLSEIYGRETITKTVAGRTERYSTSVIDGDVVDNCAAIRIHSSQKPTGVCAWVVRAYCPPGGLVADPTCGSGAVVHAARAEGRPAIGWEIDAIAADKAQRWLDGRDLPLFGGVA